MNVFGFKKGQHRDVHESFNFKVATLQRGWILNVVTL